MPSANPPYELLAYLVRVEQPSDLGREIGDRCHRHDDHVMGAFGHHQVDGIGPFEQSETSFTFVDDGKTPPATAGFLFTGFKF
jgi:hypothetical protein